jgi:hypothetical protein
MTPINPGEQQTQSYNFGATGEVIARERINPVAKAKVSGLFKLLLILLIPVGVLAAAAWFFVGRADDREYELANNVVLIVPMTSVNWQDLGVVFEPIMKLDIKTTSGYEEWEFLLDSGAVVSSLPRDWADKMGKDLALMKRSTFRGFGNSKSFAYHGEMIVRIGQEDREMPVVFTEAPGTKSLLGRKGFFEDYSVYFNHKDRQIEIRQ